MKDAISPDDGETLCDQFRYAGVHPDGGSRLCECGLKYDEHRPAAQARERSDAPSREERYAEALRSIVEVRLDTTPGVTLERAHAEARFAMRQIAEEALRA